MYTMKNTSSGCDTIAKWCGKMMARETLVITFTFDIIYQYGYMQVARSHWNKVSAFTHRHVSMWVLASYRTPDSLPAILFIFTSPSYLASIWQFLIVFTDIASTSYSIVEIICRQSQTSDCQHWDKKFSKTIGTIASPLFALNGSKTWRVWDSLSQVHNHCFAIGWRAYG